MIVPYFKPEFAVWEITQACNMRCLHCGSCATGKRKDELSTEEALDLCDQLHDLGLKYITLSGGEPLLRRDWHLIARRFIEKGVRVAMITNGYFIKENLEKFISLRPYIEQIAVSIDGIRETHDYIRQTSGSFDRSMEGLALARKLKIDTAVISCISRWNLHELEEIQREIMKRRVLAWQVQVVFPGGRMREHMSQLPQPEDIIPVAGFILREGLRFRAKKVPVDTFCADDMGYFSSICKYINPCWQGCQAGLRSIGIESDGTIKGCLSLYPEVIDKEDPFAEGNIREKSLREIWENKDGFSYNRKFDRRKVRGFCRTCKFLDLCRCGCSEVSYYATGSRYENPYCLYRLESLGYNIREPYNRKKIKEKFKDAISEAEGCKAEFYGNFKNKCRKPL